MLRAAILLIPLLATAIPTATAQTPTDSASAGPPLPGARLRVHAPSLGDPVIGELAGVRDGGLVLSIPPSRVLAVPLAGVERLDVGQRRNREELGVALGIVGGAGVMIAGFGKYLESCGSGAFSGLCEMGNTLVILGIVSGAGLGGLLGSRIGRSYEFDEWQPVDPSRLRIGVTRLEDAPALAVTIGL